MIDSRYPHLVRIEQAPTLGEVALTPWERAKARMIADAVCRRTGTRCAYHAGNGCLFFYRGDMQDSAGAFPFKEPWLSHVCLRESDIDDIVHTINIQTRPWREKERDLERQEQERKWAATEADDRHFDDVRPEAEDYAVYLDQKRRGVWKHSIAVH